MQFNKLATKWCHHDVVTQRLLPSVAGALQGGYEAVLGELLQILQTKVQLLTDKTEITSFLRSPPGLVE